jgi:hypothetical protein
MWIPTRYSKKTRQFAGYVAIAVMSMKARGPEGCPACAHPQAHFELEAANYNIVDIASFKSYWQTLLERRPGMNLTKGGPGTPGLYSQKKPELGSFGKLELTRNYRHIVMLKWIKILGITFTAVC